MKIDWRAIQKVKCHFCEATIEAAPAVMVGARRRYDYKPGRIPNWMKQIRGFDWFANGLGGCVFFLCPAHSTDKDIAEAFKWAEGNICVEEVAPRGE